MLNNDQFSFQFNSIGYLLFYEWAATNITLHFDLSYA